MFPTFIYWIIKALLRKIGINETQVDLSSFSTGIYFLEIKHQLGTVEELR